MKYDKLPLAIPGQIVKLKERGLRFENDIKAQNYLFNISYYRLRAYTYPFQDNSQDSQPFNVDVSFELIQTESYAMSKKKFSYTHFRLGIYTSNTSHYFTSSFLSDIICHKANLR